jgi:hypothetical protein
MVQQIGQYTDNGHVVRVFSAAYADGLSDTDWNMLRGFRRKFSQDAEQLLQVISTQESIEPDLPG